MAAKAAVKKSSASNLKRFDLSEELRSTAHRRKQPAHQAGANEDFGKSHEGIPEIAERLAEKFPELGLDVAQATLSTIFRANPNLSRQQLANAGMASLLEMSSVIGGPQAITSFEPAKSVEEPGSHSAAGDQEKGNSDAEESQAQEEDVPPEIGECLDEQLAMLLTLDDAALLTCVKTLLSLLRRIQEKPLEERVRRVRRGNARFQSEVGRHEAAVELLRIAGFTDEAEDTSDPALVLHGDAQASMSFARVMEALEGVLEVLRMPNVTDSTGASVVKPSRLPSAEDAGDHRGRVADITEQRLRDPRGFREAAYARGGANPASGRGIVRKMHHLDISGNYNDDTWNKEVVLTQHGSDLEVNYGGKRLSGSLEGNDVRIRTFRAAGTVASNGNIRFADGGHWTKQGAARPSAAPGRRAQHFTLTDVERMRVSDEIASTPSYADEYARAKHSAPVHDYGSIVARSYDPELLARKALDLTNQYRASKGLSPCRWHDGIARIAAEHAAQMASGAATFSHDGFDERVRAFPVVHRSAAENLAFNKGLSNVAEAAVEGWIKSPGHEKNLRGAFNLCGIGVARAADGSFYLTQLFALAV